MTSLYQHTKSNPFHISVGAVLVNTEGKICTHKILKKDMPADVAEALVPLGLEEGYILMRESLEDGETLEEGVLRGIREEFGATGKVVSYLGSIQGEARSYVSNEKFEKTTLYFLVALEEMGERPEDNESFTILTWKSPTELLGYMRRQGENGIRGDLDESKIIESYLTYEAS